MKKTILSMAFLISLTTGFSAFALEGPKTKPLNCTAIGTIPSQQGAIRSEGANVTSVCLEAMSGSNQKALSLEIGWEYTELWLIKSSRALSPTTFDLTLTYAGTYSENGFIQMQQTTSKIIHLSASVDAKGEIVKLEGTMPGFTRFSAVGFKKI